MEKNGIKHVIIGGSAGSIEVLMKLLPSLPSQIFYSICLCLHRKSGESDRLEALFRMKTSVNVVAIEDKTPLLPNAIYVAPADYHILFEADGNISLDISEKVYFSRPSIDVAFESFARVYRAQCLGILLSGANEDGAKGLFEIHKNGGLTIVQDPSSANISQMPKSALKLFSPDYILTPQALIQFLKILNPTS